MYATTQWAVSTETRTAKANIDTAIFCSDKKTIQTINYIIYSQKSPNQNALFFIGETLDSILRPLVISACSEWNV